MKALVKAHDAPGLELQDVDKPTIGVHDVLIRVKKSIDMWHRHAHMELGCVGAKNGASTHGHWP